MAASSAVVLVAQGDLTAALKAYRDSLGIRERLAAADPNNAEWQRNLSVSYDNVGNVLVAQGDLTAALKAYRDSLGIAERLAAADPNNAGWQRDLSVSYKKAGDVLWKQGDLAEALKAYRGRLTILKTLVTKDVSNKQWREDLDYIIDHISSLAYALTLGGDFSRALEAANEAISLSPDRIFIYGNRAHALMFLGQADEARAIYVQYRGKSNVVGEKTWEMTVLDDFAGLRKAGLEHPLMDEIAASFEKAGAAPQTGLVQDQAAPR